MKKYKIYAGMGGGFGGAGYQGIYEFKNKDEAEEFAWEVAKDSYEGYMGLYGIRDIEEIMEEEECDEDTAWEISCEDRDSWIDYYAEECCVNE